MRRLLVAAAFTCLLLMSGCASTASRDPGAVPLKSGKGGILGYVVSGYGSAQKRVEGVQVLIAPGLVETSDANGMFVERNVRPGTFHAYGYAGAPVDFNVTAGEYTEIHIFLDPGEDHDH